MTVAELIGLLQQVPKEFQDAKCYLEHTNRDVDLIELRENDFISIGEKTNTKHVAIATRYR